MKKFKKYIVLLFLPIVLLGCVQKGVSDSTTTNDTLGGYTWDELEAMVEDSSYGVVANRSELNYVYGSISNSSDKAEILTLYNYLLSDVFTPVESNSSSFIYSDVLSEINTQEDDIINDIDVYDYDELVTISEALTDFVSTTTSALGSTLISNINDTLSRIDSAKSTNKFYTQVYDLYLQSYGANGLKQT